MNKAEGLDRIVGVYAALLISVALMPMPNFAVALLSGAIFLCLVIFAYMMRMGQEADSPVSVHATYIIRTFWISNVIFFLTSLLAIGGMSALLYFGYIHTSALSACSNGDLSPCMTAFINANTLSFTVASFVALGPAILYLLFRFARGLARAAGRTVSIL